MVAGTESAFTAFVIARLAMGRVNAKNALV
jgi:hypothetical protein